MKMKHFLCLSLLLLATSCSKDIPMSDMQSTSKLEDVASNQLSSIDITESRELLANILSTSIRRDGTLAEISKVVNLERDGDTEVLLTELVNTSNLRSNSPVFISLSRAYDDLKSLRSANGTSTDLLDNHQSFDEFVDAIIKADPLLQVAIVGVDDTKKQDVSISEIPMVVALPNNFDEKEEVTLKGFRNGAEVLIKSSEKPAPHTIVIGRNERIVIVKKGSHLSNNRDLGDLYFEDKDYSYYLKPSILYSNTLGVTSQEADQSLRATPTISLRERQLAPLTGNLCDRERYPNYRDVLLAAKFANQDAMRNYESAWSGRPEVQYRIIPIKTKEAVVTGDCTDKGWWDGAKKHLGIRLFRWDRDVIGNAYIVYWVELDGGKAISVTLPIPVIGGNFKVDIENDDDQIGCALVQYRDPALHEYVYDVGQMFKFWICIQN